MIVTDIVCLKITLADVTPAVVRRVEVPLAIKLSDLHLVIQTAMPWTNTHLYEFRAGDEGWGVPDPDFGDGPKDARKVTLADVLPKTRGVGLLYLYDFGDGWEHMITVETMTAPDPTGSYPRLVSSEGRCPPEDVGGPPGYDELLEATADPAHERHDERQEWLGGTFDPNAVDRAAIEAEFKKLAKKLSKAKSKPGRKPKA